MKLSARNLLSGQVSELTKGPVSALVGLRLKGGAQIYANVTNDSLETLGLQVGREAFAIVKASAVIVGVDVDASQVSTRNVLAGRVLKVVDGPVNAEIDIEVGPGTVISAVITHEGARSRGFQVGDGVSAIFKASSVILGVK